MILFCADMVAQHTPQCFMQQMRGGMIGFGARAQGMIYQQFDFVADV